MATAYFIVNIYAKGRLSSYLLRKRLVHTSWSFNRVGLNTCESSQESTATADVVQYANAFIDVVSLCERE